MRITIGWRLVQKIFRAPTGAPRPPPRTISRHCGVRKGTHNQRQFRIELAHRGSYQHSPAADPLGWPRFEASPLQVRSCSASSAHSGAHRRTTRVGQDEVASFDDLEWSSLLSLGSQVRLLPGALSAIFRDALADGRVNVGFGRKCWLPKRAADDRRSHELSARLTIGEEAPKRSPPGPSS